MIYYIMKLATKGPDTSIGDRNGTPIIFGDTVIFGDKWEWYKDGYNNDERYVGEIENEKLNGQGNLTLPDGRKFVGKFKDRKMDGQGTFTFPDRTKGVGYFRGTKPWNVTKYDKEGNILGKYVNGKWIFM